MGSSTKAQDLADDGTTATRADDGAATATAELPTFGARHRVALLGFFGYACAQ